MNKFDNGGTPLSAANVLSKECEKRAFSQWITTAEEYLSAIHALGLPGEDSFRNAIRKERFDEIVSFRGIEHPLGLAWDGGAGNSGASVNCTAKRPRGCAGDVAIPREVRLMDEMMPVRDQGERGTCVAFAMTALCENAEGCVERLSPQFLYWACKEADSWNTSGTSLSVASEVLCDVGVCPESDWPYTSSAKPKAGEKGEGRGPAPKAAIAAALEHVIDTDAIPEHDVGLVKLLVACGFPVVVAVPVFGSWARSAETYRTGKVTLPFRYGEEDEEQPIGYHAMCIVGYVDDASVPGGGYFIVRNSWGEDWARESPEAPGHAVMPYDYIGEYCVGAVVASAAFDGGDDDDDCENDGDDDDCDSDDDCENDGDDDGDGENDGDEGGSEDIEVKDDRELSEADCAKILMFYARHGVACDSARNSLPESLREYFEKNIPRPGFALYDEERLQPCGSSADPAKDASGLPRRVNLADGFLPVQNQGERGSCTAFAMTALCEYMLGESRVKLSEQYLYWATKMVVETPVEKMGEGALLPHLARALEQHGICPAEKWPYNDIKNNWNNISGDGLADCIHAAKPYHVKSWMLLPSGSVFAMRSKLAAGIPVVIGINTFPSMWTPWVARTGQMSYPFSFGLRLGLDDGDETGIDVLARDMLANTNSEDTPARAVVEALKAQFLQSKIEKETESLPDCLAVAKVDVEGDCAVVRVMEKPIGRHAIVLVGYEDDPAAPGGGYFFFRNSWGEEWAPESRCAPGYGIVPYEYIRDFAGDGYSFEEFASADDTDKSRGCGGGEFSADGVDGLSRELGRLFPALPPASFSCAIDDAKNLSAVFPAKVLANIAPGKDGAGAAPYPGGDGGFTVKSATGIADLSAEFTDALLARTVAWSKTAPEILRRLETLPDSSFGDSKERILKDCRDGLAAWRKRLDGACTAKLYRLVSDAPLLGRKPRTVYVAVATAVGLADSDSGIVPSAPGRAEMNALYHLVTKCGAIPEKEIADGVPVVFAVASPVAWRDAGLIAAGALPVSVAEQDGESWRIVNGKGTWSGTATGAFLDHLSPVSWASRAATVKEIVDDRFVTGPIVVSPSEVADAMAGIQPRLPRPSEASVKQVFFDLQDKSPRCYFVFCASDGVCVMPTSASSGAKRLRA